MDTTDSPPTLTAVAWSAGAGLRALANLGEVRIALADPAERLWIDVAEPGGPLLHEVGQILGLHALVIEDIAEQNQRAKIELTGDELHLVMFHLGYVGELIASELDIVVSSRFLLSAHPADVPLTSPAFLRRGASHYLAEGTDYLLWALADRLVDDYFPVFDRLADDIDSLGEDVLRRPSSWTVERLFEVRRELLLVRHAVMPQREIFNQLINRDLPMVRPERVIFFRDVYDHLIRLNDELDSHRELVSTTLDIYLSQVNNNLSEVVRRLTAVTVVLAGVGAVAGIFGMSEAGRAFDFKESAGFWIVALGVIALGVGALLYFRRIRWL